MEEPGSDEKRFPRDGRKNVSLDLTFRGGTAGGEAVDRPFKLDAAAQAIAASGCPDAAAMAGYADHGFKAALPKLFSTAVLSSALREALG